MKNGVKRTIAAVLSAFTVFSVVTAAGCKEKIPDNENTLEMFICDFGYGTQWLEDMAEAFSNEKWVKDKYPELYIPEIATMADQNAAVSRVSAGAGTNTADLLFTCSNYGAADFVKRGTPSNYENLYTFFNEAVIPGEDVTIRDKMIPSRFEERIYMTNENEEGIYAFPWVSGYQGIFVNVTALKAALGENYTLPRTTDEFVELCDEIKKSPVNSQDVKPFISAASAHYWNTMFSIWWAQYEGVENYENYYNGVNKYGDYDVGVISQEGRLKSLEAIHSLISYESENSHSFSMEGNFVECQARFFKGEAVFMPNGDWIENEMTSLRGDDEIVVLKNPVISDIVEKTSSVKVKARELEISDDEMLRRIVDAVDANETGYEGIDQTDYDFIKKARRTVSSIAGHEAYIPSYAAAKDLAKDFLLFMASDAGIESFMRSTNGCRTAFNYDVETKNPELYGEFSQMQKELCGIAKTWEPLPTVSQFKLVYYGGFSSLKTSFIESAFMSQNERDRKSPEEVWQGDIDFYTANDEEPWKLLLAKIR